MIELFFLKYWKHLLLSVLLVASGYLVFDAIFDMGYQKASNKYEQRIKDYEDALVERINRIENHSIIYMQTTHDANTLFNSKLEKVLANVSKKNEPLYIVKEGKCTPSKEFVDSYNSIITGGNAK